MTFPDDFAGRSAVQGIELWRDPERGLTLSLDGEVQFTEQDEHVYHECLAVLPALFGPVRRCFIGGGGDGLAATRLLRLPAIERVVVCDYDPVVVDLARRHAGLRALNDASLDDARVTTLCRDAFAELRAREDHFDLVVCDFPGPFTPEVARLYAVEFYEAVRARLAPGGRVVVQTVARSPARDVIAATLREVFPHVRYFQPVRCRESVGFTLAALAPFAPPAPVPSWTRYLTDDVVPAGFASPRDERAVAPYAHRDGDTRLTHDLLRDVFADAAPPHPQARGLRRLAIDDALVVPDALVPVALPALAGDGALVVAVEASRVGTHHRQLTRLGLRAARSYRVLTFEHSPAVERALRAAWKRLGVRGLAAVEARTARTRELPEVAARVARQLATGRAPWLELPGADVDTASLLDRERVHLLVRRADGSPALVLGLVLDPRGLRVDLTWSDGLVREAKAALLLCLQYAGRRLADPLVLEADQDARERFLLDAGLCPRQRYVVYAPRAVARPRRRSTSTKLVASGRPARGQSGS